jgi:tetratricopeptide (TPR) repeat protein
MRNTVYLILFIFLSINGNSQSKSKLSVDNPRLSFLLEDAHNKWRSDDYSEAIKNLDSVIDEDTLHCSWPYSHRAFLKVLNKDYLGAISDYTYAIENEKHCVFYFKQDGLKVGSVDVPIVRLYFERGKVKIKTEDYMSAISDFNEVIKINKTFSEAFYERGNVKYFLGDDRGAISDYNIVLNLKPTFPYNYNLYFYRGCAKKNLKDYQGALLDLNKYIERNKEDDYGYLIRGIIQLNLNQKDKACMDFSRAGELGNSEAYDLIKKYCN